MPRVVLAGEAERGTKSVLFNHPLVLGQERGVLRYRLASKNHTGHIGYFCRKALMPLGRASISQHGGDPEMKEAIPYI